MPSEAVTVALIGVIPLILTALWQGWKTRAEVAAIMSGIQHTRARVDEAVDDTTTLDALSRVEREITALRADHRALAARMDNAARQAALNYATLWDTIQALHPDD